MATDRAGNRSPEQCGKLVVGRERPETRPLAPRAIPTQAEVTWPSGELYKVIDRPLLKLRFATGWKVESLELYRITCETGGGAYQQRVVVAPAGISPTADVPLSYVLGAASRFNLPTVEPGIYAWRLTVSRQTGAKSIERTAWSSPTYLVTDVKGSTVAATSMLDSGATNIAASLPATGGDVPLTFNACSGTAHGTLDVTVYEADGKTEVDHFTASTNVMLPGRTYEIWWNTPDIPAGTTGARRAFLYCAVLSDRGYKSSRGCGGIFVNVLRR